jgi:7,8-dihydro-6-hydroxymethylpterin-pyrophosphokinase
MIFKKAMYAKTFVIMPYSDCEKIFVKNGTKRKFRNLLKIVEMP